MAANKRLFWSPSSRRDLIQIYGYFSRVVSDAVAEQLLMEIEVAVERLKTNPLIGVPRFEILPNLRAIYSRPYTILYRLMTDSVEISRVVHERREPLAADGISD